MKTMTDAPSFETDLLISGCLNVSAITGVQAPYLIAHALLFATAVIGGAACYVTHPDLPPQVIGTPATLLSSDDQCPYWFASATGGAVDLQRCLIRRVEMKTGFGNAPTQIKMAKRMMKAHPSLGHVLPESLQKAVIHGLPHLKPSSVRFLHDLRNGTVQKDAFSSDYGPHLLAYAEGESCYRDLIDKRLRPGSLHAMASDPSAETRVTIHGWAELGSIKSLLRKWGFKVVPAFGLLMSVPDLGEQPFPLIETSGLYLHFFNLILQLRIDWPKVFLPEDHVIEVLDAEVLAQADRYRFKGLVRDVINPIPMLPWNIATVLWAIERNTCAEPEKISALAEKACEIARFIHELHVHTLLRIFPASKDGSSDSLHASIVDKLSVRPLKLRELMRKSHRSDAEDLRLRLGLLEREGVIEKVFPAESGRVTEKWRAKPFPIESFPNMVLRLSAKHQNLPK